MVRAGLVSLAQTVLEDIKKKEGVDPFSWKFMFHEHYANLRNGFFLGSDPEERHTVLSVLVKLIDAERRAQIFPGTFDLGNGQAVEEKYNNKDLAKELSRELSRTSDDNRVNPYKDFRLIEQWLEAMTGQNIEEHLGRNSSKTLKVVKLFYRVQKLRRNSVFKLIRSVNRGARPSLERRDRYPLKGNESSTWLLADLKAYLGMELDEARIDRIDQIFSILLRAAGSTAAALSATVSARGQGDATAMASLYREFAAALGGSKRLETSSGALLDEQIYIYLHAQEFLNYVEEYRQIVEKTTPGSSITPVLTEMNAICEKIAHAGGGPRGSEPTWSLENISSMYRVWIDDLIPIVEKATARAVDRKKYDELTSRAGELLYRYLLFRWGDVHPSDYEVNVFEWVVAACAVWHEMCATTKEKTKYKIYWFDQSAQGSGILPALDASLYRSIGGRREPYPEAIHQIWVHRFEWMKDALQGLADLSVAKASFRVAALQHVASIVKCNDIDMIESALQLTPVSFAAN